MLPQNLAPVVYSRAKLFFSMAIMITCRALSGQALLCISEPFQSENPLAVPDFCPNQAHKMSASRSRQSQKEMKTSGGCILSLAQSPKSLPVTNITIILEDLFDQLSFISKQNFYHTVKAYTHVHTLSPDGI